MHHVCHLCHMHAVGQLQTNSSQAQQTFSSLINIDETCLETALHFKFPLLTFHLQSLLSIEACLLLLNYSIVMSYSHD